MVSAVMGFSRHCALSQWRIFAVSNGSWNTAEVRSRTMRPRTYSKVAIWSSTACDRGADVLHDIILADIGADCLRLLEFDRHICAIA